MSRGTFAFDARVKGPAALAAGVLLVLLGGWTCVALQPAPEAEPLPPDRHPVSVNPPAGSALVTVPTPAPEAPVAPPVTAAAQPRERALPGLADMPYRFVGRSASGAERSIVLFGRGRVVTLNGPGPLDDDYVVDAIFDGYVMVRHVPTASSRFLPLAARPATTPLPASPEDSAQD